MTTVSARALNAFPGIPMLYGGCCNQGLSTANDPGGTARMLFYCQQNMNSLRAVYENSQISSSAAGDLAAPNPITVSASLEDNYSHVTPFTFGGRSSVCIQSNGLVYADPLQYFTNIGSLGNTFWVRTYVQIAVAPTSPTIAGSTTGGTLASGAHYYKITAVCGANGEQGESGPSSEVTVTNTGSTSSNTLTWTMDSRSVPAAWFKIYRSATTGTEVYLTTVQVQQNSAGAYSWVDTGAISIGSGSPPAAQQYPWNFRCLARAGQSNNYVANSGTGANALSSSGTLSDTLSYAYGPMALLGVPLGGVYGSVTAVMGDSIADGDFGTNPGWGWPNQALFAANLPWWHLPQSGEEFNSIIPGATWGFFHRGKLLNSASAVICQYGTNDVFVLGSSLATLQANAIALWTFLAQMGLSVVQSTMLPRTTGTYAAAGNQSLITPNETVRENFNTWLRDGAPILSGAAAAAGSSAAGTLRASQPGHPLVLSSTLFDVCTAVETNNAGTLTTNGGYWLANATIAGQSFAGTHPTQYLVTAIIGSITTGIAALANYTL